jgi:hypothetical protein
MIKCGVQGPMRPWECVWVWNTLLQMGESARDGAQWLLSAFPLWELHWCESPECLKPCLERKTSTNLGPYNVIGKVLKCKCLKCLRIIHLNFICMSYDQKKGQKSNYWKLDSWSQIPLELGVKWSPIGACNTPLERIF